jgi:predicted MFS family arabinose efflux permease
MNIVRRNVLVLATCQMLFGASRSLLISTAPLVAYTIGTNKALATLPTSLVIVGTAIATIPASLFMRRAGRQLGFLAGTGIAAIGGVICTVAALRSEFWLFALGALVFGMSAGFSQLYRFAAADTAGPDYRARAISLVLAAGVVAAFVGPELAKAGKDMIAHAEFAGAYLLLIGVTVLVAATLAFLRIPKLTRAEREGPQRPLSVIMTQPVFIAATLSAAIAQGVMSFLMTATPIAMRQCNYPFADTALVIEWHIFAMFAPGFVTGSLIRRFGEVRIITAGILLQLICVGFALAGQSVMNFWASMALLGLGWNFAFTGGTSLMTQAYTVAERAKAQGATNFVIFAFVALLSLSSGALIHYFGWMWVNLGALPLIAISGASILWYAERHPRPQALAS